MASKTLGTILTLNDRMSPKLIKVSKKVQGLNKDAQRATYRMANMANKFKSNVDQMASKATKFAAIGAGLAGAFAFKTGLSESIDLEGYRMQLETATKDTKKAADIMKYSIQLANKTPFEGGELVEGAAKFEAMGMSAKKWLPLVGDMAAATNKPFDQAVEALIDVQTGELERLKEFGLTKAKIAEQGEKMFGKALVNNKGQITDMEKFNEATIALMNNKFAGGMEKQSKTLRGMWSTVTGVTKSALAKMLGMQEDGTIKSGSLLETLKGKVDLLRKKFEKWQSDGTLDRIADKFNKVFTAIYNIVSKTFGFIKKHQDVILFLLTFAGTFMIVSKAVGILKGAFIALKIATLLLSGTLKLTPLGWIITLISLAIAIGALLWKNWDKIKEKAGELCQGVKDTFGGIRDAITGAFTSAKEKVSGFFSWIFEKISSLNKKVEEVPVIGSLYKGFKAVAGGGVGLIGTGIGAIKDKLFAKGGIATRPSIFGEAGAEIAIPLKRTQRSKQLLNQANSIINGNGSQNNVFNISINGVGKSTDEIVDELVPKLKLALDNM